MGVTSVSIQLTHVPENLEQRVALHPIVEWISLPSISRRTTSKDEEENLHAAIQVILFNYDI
jgi:hypothetical protein